MFMISCSGGDSESSASNNGSLVKRAVTDATVFEYSYNGNKIATISALNQLQTFTYSGNLITKTSRFLNGHSVADFEVKYEYDANQQLIKETFLIIRVVRPIRKYLHIIQIIRFSIRLIREI